MGNITGRRETDDGGERGIKRKREANEEQEISEHSDVLNTPKRKRIKSTSKYIYQTLFLDGENSDVTILALGKEWKLHKLYLKQSPYFASMFSGAWKESSMEKIEIEIMDENINEESMKIALGSLYKDDIILKPVQMIGVLAAGTLLQLDGLIQQCVSMMTDTLSSSTVCVYHTACVSYGLEEMKNTCVDWLMKNLLVSPDLTYIRDISIDLMKDIVSSPFLYVMQVEIDIYTLLKKWIFLKHNTSWSGSPKDLLKETDSFIKQSVSGTGQCFLEIDGGMKYSSVFSHVRWHHVINDMSSIKMIENDQVLPIGWLEPMFLYGWRHVLHIEQGLDKGPTEIEESVFNEACSRCGRILSKQGDYCWRWVGYSYGIDLLVSVANRLITLKRNTSTETCPQAVSLLAQRQLCYRLCISSLDKDGKTLYSKSTGIKKISLGKDEQEIALVLEKKVEYPLLISMNILLVSPIPETPIPRLKIPETILTKMDEETTDKKEPSLAAVDLGSLN